MRGDAYIELLNSISRKQLMEVHQALHEADPVRFNGAGLQTIEEMMELTKQQIDFATIKSLANKYHVRCWDDCVWFIYQLTSYDDRDEERCRIRRQKDKELNDACKERLQVLEAIELMQSRTSVVLAKGRPQVTLRNDIINDFATLAMLKELFEKNKDLYRHYLGVADGVEITPSLDMVPLLKEKEAHNIESYRQMIELKEGDREVALRLYLFADLFHKIEVWEEFEKKGIVNPAIQLRVSPSWANTEKSCFIVDALAYYKVVPDYCLDYTPQEKYQYVKKKMQQLERLMKKL